MVVSDPGDTMLTHVRAWAKLAIPAVLIGSMGTSFLNDWLHPLGLATGVIWAVSASVGLRRPWVRGVEVLALAACFAFVGPAATGMFGITIAMATMSLRLGSALAFTLGLTITVIVTMVAISSPSIGIGIRPYAIAVPALVMFMVGRALRSSVLRELAAARQAADLSHTNIVLGKSLKSAAKLASTRERTRIARELHDSLGHCLTTAHVHLQLARRAYEAGSDTTEEALGHAGEAVRLGIVELRRCVAVMRDPETDKALSEVMRSFIDELPESDLVAQLRVEGDEHKLPPEREFVLFRALQESLTNVTKHAGARTVRITLEYKGGGRVRLEVVDDGGGATSIEGGYGLPGLAERVEAVGGRLETRTTPGEGFWIGVELGGPP